MYAPVEPYAAQDIDCLLVARYADASEARILKRVKYNISGGCLACYDPMQLGITPGRGFLRNRNV